MPPAPGGAIADVEAGAKAYRDGDYNSARRVFEAAADLGRPEGLHHLGVLHWLGLGGLERSPAHAAALFQLAAEAGYAPSLFNLGILHSRGEGVAADADAAAHFFERAAQAGNLNAMFQLGQA